MGLANHFGDQAYQCKSCGHKMALYAPCCPVCLNKSITAVKTETRSGEAFRTADQEIGETRKPDTPVATYVGLAVLAAICLAVLTMFSPPRPASVAKPDLSPKIEESTARSQANSSSVLASSRRNKHPNIRPVVSRAHVSTARSSTPKPVTPMKLWEASSDDEGGN